MIKRLRIQFVGVASVSLLVVLVVMVAVANIVNYTSIVSSAESSSELVMQADEQSNDYEFLFNLNNQGKNILDTSYFSVRFDKTGKVERIDTRGMGDVSLDSDDVSQAARAALNSGKKGDFVGSFRYRVFEGSQFDTVVFVDCWRSLSNFRLFLATSIGAALLCFVLVFAVLILVSKRAVAPYAESYAKQRRFISDAGHELKTPLTIIDADAEIVEMESGESEWLDDIRYQTKRLAQLTNDLVFLSKMDEAEGRQAKEQLESVPLSDMLDETLSHFKSRAVVEGKTLESDIAEGIVVHGNEKTLSQLIGLLADNAFKYSPEGGTIRVSLKTKGSTAVLTVYNTAENIKRGELKHYFDRFYRSDESRNSETGGHGLGLAIARAIVEQHKGSIEATTADEKSVTFTVKLPVK